MIQKLRNLFSGLQFFTKTILILAISLSLQNKESLSQIPDIIIPQPASMQPNINIENGTQTFKYKPSNSNMNSQLEMHERDKRQLKQQNEALYKQIYRESAFPSPIRYSLPSYSNVPSTTYFHKALNQLNDMLTGNKPISLKDAVYIVENAYLEGRIDYNKYNNELQNIINKAKLKCNQDGYNWNNSLTRNLMLFKTFSDTLVLKDPANESNFTSYPFTYDFDDFFGKQNYSKMLVAKLLATKSGQCHSLPLAFLICAEETNTEAFLAFSPSHSYVKFRDPMNNWYNLELTNGKIVSDAFITGSGFIKSEALKSKIYTDTLSLNQTIAYCMTDLAKEYTRKYGYDEFVLQCVNTALEYYPNNIYGLQIKSDYYTVLFNYVIQQTERPNPEILKTKYPKAYDILIQRNELYQTIDNLGYCDMPEEAYKDWLKSVNKEKQIQENQTKTFQLSRTIK